MRGIVSASWAHLRQLGGEWVAPFTIRLLDAEVCILSTAPKRVLAVLRAHARRHLDRVFIAKLANQYATEDEISRIIEAYSNGVDWNNLRLYLRGVEGRLSLLERRALHLSVTTALWPEERRWRAGLLGVGSCSSCWQATATHRHRFRDCDGVRQHLTWQRIAGREVAVAVQCEDPALLPLLLFGLPPRRDRWQPVAGRRNEGALQAGRKGDFFGDGSGIRQDYIPGRRSTWALIAASSTDLDGFDEEQRIPPDRYVRGAVVGWDPTVPRAEVRAAIAFLETAAPGSTYYGDCRYVIDVAAAGIPQ